MTNVNSRVEPLISFLEEETGFVLNDKKKEELSFFIKRRTPVIRVNTLDRYLDHIRSPNGSEELMNLIEFLTVGETFFFRNKSHWQAFKGFVLPKIIDANRQNTKKLKFWSAGCCTGEEAYSIAIFLKEAFPVLETWAIKIIATDINQISIEKAREGLYRQNSFRGEDSYFIERYFLKEQGKYRIREEIREMVDFEQFNLVSKADFPSKHKECDVIFCRNVLMYFHPKSHEDIIKKFAFSLKEEGFLF